MGSTEITGSAIAAYITAEIIQWAKCHPKVAMLQIDAKRLNRWMSALIAIVVSLGIHATFDRTTGVLTITGLFAGSIFDHIGEALRQWVFQQLIYRTAIQPNQRNPNAADWPPS